MHFTVFYNGQFWVGVAQQETASGLKAIEHIFGAEPSLQEIYLFVNADLAMMLSQAISAPVQSKPPKIISNPKRAARETAREIKGGVKLNKAYEAVRLAREAQKENIKRQSKKEREEIARSRRILKKVKARNKRKGH